MVTALERDPFVAGRLVEFLVVGLHLFEGIRRGDFVILDRKLAQRRTVAIRPPPFGQCHMPIKNLARLELVLLGFRPSTAARIKIDIVFRSAALRDRNQRQVQVATSLRRGGDKYARHRGVGPLERVE